MTEAEAKLRVTELVRTLFRAENGPGGDDADDNICAPRNTPQDIRDVAAGILATGYLPVVRGSGQADASREDTLKKIAAGSPSFRRHVARAEIQVDLFLDNRAAIVRSLLPATDSRTAPIRAASYRNLHVFLMVDGEWKCIAWQVTEVR